MKRFYYWLNNKSNALVDQFLVIKTSKLFTLILALSFSITTSFAQYIESFDTPNKGIIFGPCGSDVSTCVSSDLTGVDWSITGDLSGSY